MKAAWYEKQGAAGDVLIVGEIDSPQPRTGEVGLPVAERFALDDIAQAQKRVERPVKPGRVILTICDP